MPTVLLVRHGRTAANASGVLAGWTPGVGLDETGQKQVQTLAQRLAPVPVSLAVASPLQRCQETAAALLGVPHAPDASDEPAGDVTDRPELLTDDRLGECKYGDWTGRKLADLAKEPLWKVVQAHPSAAAFPGEGGESMLQMQTRAVTAIREHDARVAEEFGPNAVWLAVSHGDVIKAILADALGMHFDQFQRIVVDPASLSVIRFTTLRPFAVRVNDSSAELGFLTPPKPSPDEGPDEAPGSESDAAVGGGAGARAHTDGTA